MECKKPVPSREAGHVVGEMKRLSTDILGLCEIRWNPSKQMVPFWRIRWQKWSGGVTDRKDRRINC